MAEVRIIPESIQLIKMSDEEYFSEKYREFISNSKLSLFNEDEGGSLEKYLEGFKSSYSESFELGSAVHSIVLQPEYYAVSRITKPTAKLGMFAEEVFKLRQDGYPIWAAIKEASLNADYYAGKLTDNKLKTAINKSLPFYLNRLRIVENFGEKIPIYLSDSMKYKFEQCLLGIESNQTVKNLLNPRGLLDIPEVFNEYAIFCSIVVKTEEFEVELKIKGKLDSFTIDHEAKVITLNDLKTSGKPCKFFMGNEVIEIDEEGNETNRWFDGSFQKYHYARQLGLYVWLLQAAIKTIRNCEGYKFKANMLVVETVPNFKSIAYPVNSKEIRSGLDEFKKIIVDIAKWKYQTQKH